MNKYQLTDLEVPEKEREKYCNFFGVENTRLNFSSAILDSHEVNDHNLLQDQEFLKFYSMTEQEVFDLYPHENYTFTEVCAFLASGSSENSRKYLETFSENLYNRIPRTEDSFEYNISGEDLFITLSSETSWKDHLDKFIGYMLLARQVYGFAPVFVEYSSSDEHKIKTKVLKSEYKTLFDFLSEHQNDLTYKRIKHKAEKMMSALDESRILLGSVSLYKLFVDEHENIWIFDFSRCSNTGITTNSEEMKMRWDYELFQSGLKTFSKGYTDASTYSGDPNEENIEMESDSDEYEDSTDDFWY